MPAILGRLRADADLDRARRLDQALARGTSDEGAMVDAVAGVGPGVLVRVELDQGQRPVDAPRAP